MTHRFHFGSLAGALYGLALLLILAIAAPHPARAQTPHPAQLAKPEIRLSSQIITDPLGSARPKALPGALVEYQLQVSNVDTALLGGNGLAITSPIPSQMMLLVPDGSIGGAAAIRFDRHSAQIECSFTARGLPDDCLQFSNNGGASFDYVPQPGADGADDHVTHIRFRIRAGPDPSPDITQFSLSFRMIME